jgi:hypothetical protein
MLISTIVTYLHQKKILAPTTVMVIIITAIKNSAVLQRVALHINTIIVIHINQNAPSSHCRKSNSRHNSRLTATMSISAAIYGRVKANAITIRTT